MALRKITASIVAAIIISLVGCRGKDDDAPKAPPLVKTIIVGDYHRTTMRTFPGTVSADQQVDLAFQVSGRIEQLPIKEGSKLKRGELIAALDPQSYQALYDRTNARFVLADAQLKRATVLVKKGYLSQSGYDQRVSDYDVSKADFDRAKIDLDDTQLLAPFDGLVTKKIVDNHQYVQAKQSIVMFKAVDEINIEANIPERVIAHIEARHNSVVKVIFEVAPNKTFDATLKEFSADADPQTKTYKVTVTLPRPQKPTILPGMTARIEVSLATGKGAYLLLPASAVFKREAQPMVWMMKSDDQTVTATAVQVGQLRDSQIEIISGVSRGDRIVAAGVNFLQEGEKVTVMKAVTQEESQQQRNG